MGSTAKTDKITDEFSKKMMRLLLQQNNNIDIDNYILKEDVPNNATESSDERLKDMITHGLVENDYISLSPNKRTSQLTSFTCPTSTRWRDLGNRHYPRFLKEETCRSEALRCFNNFYTCRPVVYAVKVLTFRDQDDADDNRLPISLRDSWKFASIDIAVACQCVE